MSQPSQSLRESSSKLGLRRSIEGLRKKVSGLNLRGKAAESAPAPPVPGTYVFVTFSTCPTPLTPLSSPEVPGIKLIPMSTTYPAPNVQLDSLEYVCRKINIEPYAPRSGEWVFSQKAAPVVARPHSGRSAALQLVGVLWTQEQLDRAIELLNAIPPSDKFAQQAVQTLFKENLIDIEWELNGANVVDKGALFSQEQVQAWYARYNNIEVPTCSQGMPIPICDVHGQRLVGKEIV